MNERRINIYENWPVYENRHESGIVYSSLVIAAVACCALIALALLLIQSEERYQALHNYCSIVEQQLDYERTVK